MKKVRIYLRSILENGERRLELSDSNGNGGIDNLLTEAQRGDTIIWELDTRSGIKAISKVYSKTGKHNVFKTGPKKRFLCKGLKLPVSNDAEGEEAYYIEYILEDGTKLKLDPWLKVIPPP